MHMDWDRLYSPYYYNWLEANSSVPIYMRRIYEEVSMSCAYPFKDVFRMTGHIKHREKPLKYLTGTPMWALALAVLQGKDVIDVYGIEMQDREYQEQAECFAFWVGFAGGRGIQLNIHCADAIFKRPLYGAQPYHG